MYNPYFIYKTERVFAVSAKTVEKMIEWLEDNISNSPTLPKMASFVGYSEYYCSAKFHEFTGMTFKEYLSKRRLSNAAESLKSTDSRIIDIALDCGFSSSEAFSRAFGKEYGCSPKNYRAKRKS